MRKNLLTLSFLACYCVVWGQEVNGPSSGQLSLRANTLSWAILAPNLGLEYQLNNKIAVLVEGSYAHWNFKNDRRDQYWHLWHISPKIRNYVNPSRNAYIGLQFDMGAYNISSQQGKFIGGGIAFGKQYYLTKNSWIDLGITFGALQLSEREKYYEYKEDHYLSSRKPAKNYWGPTQLSIAIIRKLNTIVK